MLNWAMATNISLWDGDRAMLEDTYAALYQVQPEQNIGTTADLFRCFTSDSGLDADMLQLMKWTFLLSA